VPTARRPIRVLVAKVGLDGHDRGVKIVARALRDGGMEVVYTGLHRRPEEVVRIAVEEDVDLIGVSILSGAHLTLVPRIIDGMKEHGIDAEVLDLRTLIPLDAQAVLRSLAKTSRLFTVEENPRVGGWGAEIAALAADEGFYSLDAPIVRITTPHVPLPAADVLEDAAMPSVERIVETVRKSMR